MNTALLHFDLQLTAFYYPVFYFISLLTFIGITSWEAGRNGISMTLWTIILAFCITCMIVFSKIGELDWFVILEILKGGGHHAEFSKSAFWGGIGFLSGLFISIKYLKLGIQVLDIFAFALPAMMIIQRIGCLLAACCFGLSSNGPLAIQYTGISILRDHQIINGLISAEQLSCIPVHAVPIYFIIGNVLIIWLLLILKQKRLPDGTLFILSGIAMMSARFLIEFVRDPITNNELGIIVYGLKKVQWSVLVLIFCFIAFWIYNQKVSKGTTQAISINWDRTFSLGMSNLVLLACTHRLFAIEELSTILLINGIALFFAGRQIIDFNLQKKLMAMTTIIVFGNVFFFNQTFVHVETDTVNRLPRNYYSLGVHYLDAKDTRYPCVIIEQGCFGNYCAKGDSAKAKGPGYGLVQANFERWVPKAKRNYFIYGADMQWEQYTGLAGILDFQRNNWNVHSYLGYQTGAAFGFRLGLRLGQIYMGFREYRENVFFVPSFQAYWGNVKWFWGGIGVYQTEGMGPGPSLFSTFVKANTKQFGWKTVEQMGVQFGEIYAKLCNFSLQTALRIKKHILIKPSLGITVRRQESPAYSGGLQLQIDLNSKR